MKNFDMSFLSAQFKRGCHALADIQEYFDHDTWSIANGKIISESDNASYVAKSKLNSFDLYEISKEAKISHYYEGAVHWLTSAVQMAKSENCTKKYQITLR